MLEIKTFTFGPFFTNMYVVHNGQGNVLIIDPACSNPYEAQKLYPYVESLKSKILNPKLSLIATHGHLDHLWGAKALCEKWGTPVLMHEADIPMAERMQEQYDLFGVYRVAEAFPIESLTVKRSYSDSGLTATAVLQRSGLSVIETPGHTPGSVCLYFPEDKVLFSGDTLFRMGYGRTDLPGGNWEKLCESLTRLFELPSDVRVYPGHGDPTTIGAERRPV